MAINVIITVAETKVKRNTGYISLNFAPFCTGFGPLSKQKGKKIQRNASSFQFYSSVPYIGTH